MKWAFACLAILLVAPFTTGIPYRFTLTRALPGQVVDAQNQRPIVARLYYEHYPDHVVASAPDGRFFFPPIHEWEWARLGGDVNPSALLVATATGYQATTQIIHLGDDRAVVILMTPNNALERP